MTKAGPCTTALYILYISSFTTTSLSSIFFSLWLMLVFGASVQVFVPTQGSLHLQNSHLLC